MGGTLERIPCSVRLLSIKGLGTVYPQCPGFKSLHRHHSLLLVTIVLEPSFPRKRESRLKRMDSPVSSTGQA
jgi:hypothetical protein